ncbi:MULTISPECIES: inorganic phosphate transporter [Rhodanobacter]|uniref:inorganic phosphate transporter n=1 Tax=Rhodanobacter TaxID=75309 RepID=UPI000426AE09|nr:MULTISPECIES: inorganic phosphate transporter [Rhodanobacter]TAN18192.1 MAG: inorganic phosphate transporter [Rhodanobacter sp.]UJJ53348.1 inorganic phosphate transporter family protein [Rhodanobacter thiooxydans]
METLLVLTVLFLAATNGANDNFKGVAVLYGSRRGGYWTSLGWASITTLAGSLSSVFLARALLKAFTGAGLVPAEVAAQLPFALAVAGGAGITVALAAWRGQPISTTHALVGAMSGVGLMAVGSAVKFGTLGHSFLLPLLATPVIAVLPAYLLAPWLRRLTARAEREPECECTVSAVQVSADGLMLRTGMPVALAGTVAECESVGARRVWRPDARGLVDGLLYLSGGAVSFARGLNDTPKIAALLLPVAALDGNASALAVGLAMLVGGLLGAARVARTMSDRITRLDAGGALAAGLTTSLLVGTASFSGLPVSTTHVSVGALAGSGISNGAGVDRPVMTAIVLSWLITVPVGAMFGALLYLWLG